MKEIRVADQFRLGLVRLFQITADGIKYRLFRALVTVAVIAVAVAFLLNILSESLIARAVAADTRGRLERARLVHAWASRLAGPPHAEAILRRAAQAEPGGPEAEELARMGDIDARPFAAFSQAAKQAVDYLDFFAELAYAPRRRLVHQAQGIAILERLSSQDRFDEFADILKRTPSVRLPGSVAELRAFLAGWPALRAQVEQIRAGYAEAADKVMARLDGRTRMAALAEAEGAFGDRVRAAGFDMSRETARLVAVQAGRALDMQAVEKTLDRQEIRQMLARRHGIQPGDVTTRTLWRFLARHDRAAEFAALMKGETSGDPALDPDRLAELSSLWSELIRLERAARLTAGLGNGWMGLGPRMAWLLAVSMLVCAIGISNAMLMAVTERFREIATLKCLGAMDGSIMVMFVLESCILGVVGGVAGGIGGALLGSARMLWAFGFSFAGSLPVAELTTSIGFALLTGVLLAAVAAVYPAFRAARMAPMEAMRIE